MFVSASSARSASIVVFFDEATLFRVSHAYESATDWHKRRPPLAVAPTKTTARTDQSLQ